MFKNILVPIDLTNKHQRTLDTAAELAAQAAGTVTLLHVVELIPGLGLEEERPFYDRLEQMVRKHFEHLVPQFAAPARLAHRGPVRAPGSDGGPLRHGIRHRPDRPGLAHHRPE